MFKRSTKLTALLVAAASVASTVPAMAATKLATKDGTIEKAVAYKDGKYLYQGYRSDEDDNGLYIGDGSEKDKKLDDADEIVEKYGNKYVAAKDGSTDYVVNLETGKITEEDDTLDDLQANAETKLTNKLNKTDRYGEKFEYNVAPTKVASNKFEDVYYNYVVKQTDKDAAFDMFGYTNDSGKYIDCSYDLNLYAYSTTSAGAKKGKELEKKSEKGKMYKVEDIKDKAKTDDGQIEVTGIQFVKYIGQDNKYIYSVIKVELKNAYDLYTNEKLETSTHYYVQKVSKEQGDKEDDAYKPKSTECFEIAPEKTNDELAGLGNGDVNDAFKILLADTKIDGVTDDGFDKTTGAGDFDGKNVRYAVVDGVIYAYFEDSTDKAKIFKMGLKTSEKLDRRLENGAKNKDASKISAHVAKKDGDKDHDMTDATGEAKPWTIDANGALWIIDEGKIYRSVKMGDFEEMYTCDRSLDCIDVYDENNLVAWDSDGDVYTTVSEGSKAAKEEAKDILGEDKAEDTTTTVKTGWDQLADGTWNLYDATGAKVTGWANVGGVWYYMDKTTAVMKTGWVNDNGTWYYCNASGAMQTGWLLDGSTWYYLQSNGAMKTGWFQDTDGRWYYLNANGSMAANTTVDGYVLGANGAWIK